MEIRNSETIVDDIKEELLAQYKAHSQATIDDDKIPNDIDLDAYARYLKINTYKGLKERNGDMIGWIEIPGTHVNYPVMQTIKSPNYYLDKNFEKKSYMYGTPYVSERCDVNKPSDNLIIYGHAGRYGYTMFTDLLMYKRKSYYDTRKIINFDTMHSFDVYEICYLIDVDVNTGNDQFKYYYCYDFATEADFNDFVKKCEQFQMYDTGVKPQYGDKLITLSTCDLNKSNFARFVVVAKLVSSDPYE